MSAGGGRNTTIAMNAANPPGNSENPAPLNSGKTFPPPSSGKTLYFNPEPYH